MEGNVVKNPGSQVRTGKGQPWESGRISRIINLMPDGGSLAISRGNGTWRIECRIDGRLLLRAEGQEPGGHLEYIEDLLKKLKGFDKDA